MDALFNLPPSLSPRLLWMQRHEITTQEHGPNDDDETWTARVKLPSGRVHERTGKTEDDALTALAVAAGIKMWMEE